MFYFKRRILQKIRSKKTKFPLFTDDSTMKFFSDKEGASLSKCFVDLIKEENVEHYVVGHTGKFGRKAMLVEREVKIRGPNEGLGQIPESTKWGYGADHIVQKICCGNRSQYYEVLGY